LEAITPSKGKINTKTKIMFGVGIAVLLASGAPPPTLADELVGDGLSPAQIFRNVEESYASLTTYSDEGCVVIANDDDILINFTTRLARTKFYRIEWKQTDESSDQTRNASTCGVWSSGAGDFLQAERGVQPQGNREIALAHAADFSGGATATIPRLFFNMRWGDQGMLLDDLALSEKRQADEKMGNISCYVFTGGSQGQTNTLWIGKQDFLVHQVRRVISADAMREIAARVPRMGPELFPAMHGFTLTETHTNIVLNRKFSRADFIPSFPCFQPDDE
jgi:hypothetical protein